MKRGNWISLDVNAAKTYLPKYCERKYTFIEAIVSLTLDVYNNDIKPIRYYASLWGWGRHQTKTLVESLKDGHDYKPFRYGPNRELFIHIPLKSPATHQPVTNHSPATHQPDDSSNFMDLQVVTDHSPANDRPLTDHSPAILKDNNIYIKEKEKKKRSQVRFVRPSLEEVQAYCEERGNHVDPFAWFDYYSANGWVIGKARAPMRDWQAAVRTWERNNGNGNGKEVKEAWRIDMERRLGLS